MTKVWDRDTGRIVFVGTLQECEDYLAAQPGWNRPYLKIL